jgi:hypothetical protein
MTQPVNSTQYRFSYQIRSPEDIPDDFLISKEDLNFESGIFVQQDHFSSQPRRTSHLPRIFFLVHRCLKIYTHPISGQAAVVIPIDDLEVVEVGRFLLLSWMRFFTPAGSHTFFFGSVDGRIVDRLLRELRCVWLPCVPSAGVCFNRLETTGYETTFKFQQRFQKELDAEETAQETLFFAHRNMRPKRYLFRDVAYVGGDLLSVTSKRILWITDHDQSERTPEIYGSIARYAPVGHVQSISLDDRRLLIAFQTGRSWSISSRYR